MVLGARGQPWCLGLTSPCACTGQASAAAATAELLKKQEELNRKAEELDRRERELQHAALGGTAREWIPVRVGRASDSVEGAKRGKPKSMGAGARLLSLNLGAVAHEPGALRRVTEYRVLPCPNL